MSIYFHRRPRRILDSRHPAEEFRAVPCTLLSFAAIHASNRLLALTKWPIVTINLFGGFLSLRLAEALWDLKEKIWGKFINLLYFLSMKRFVLVEEKMNDNISNRLVI